MSHSICVLYLCLNLLVQGTFGEVYKADYNGKTVAVKKLKIPEMISEEYQESIYSIFRKEVNIIWYYEIYSTKMSARLN
jgi:serine/threonine protein kinase